MDAKAQKGIIAELNKTYAVVKIGGQVRILEETKSSLGQTKIEFTSVQQFLYWLLNEPKVNGLHVGEYWLKHPARRQYRKVVFEPGKETDEDVYNLWNGFALKPRKGNCTLYLLFLRDVICDSNEEAFQFTLDWMSHAVQRPWEKPEVAIVLRGPKGVGKGTLADIFGSLFGEHFTQITQIRHLLGNFNAHLENKVLVFADEAYWPGKTQQYAGALKGLITEPRLIIERKGVNSFEVRNCLRLIFASNEDWVVPASLNERRFFVLDVSNKHAQDHDYFAKLRKQMNRTGKAALLYFLKNRDISQVNLRKAPNTNGLVRQKIQSLPMIGDFVLNLLHNAVVPNLRDWPHDERVFVSASQLRDAYKEHAKSKRARIEDERVFGKVFKEFVPGVRKKRLSLSRKNRKLLGYNTEHDHPEKREWVYDFPYLEDGRKGFDKIIGGKIDWPEETNTH